MSDKPTDVPEWASSASDPLEKKEPTAGVKASGSVPTGRIPAQYFNWLMYTIYTWILWLSEGVTRRASLTDNSPVLATGDRDGNIRTWVDPNGYTFGNVISDTYQFDSGGGDITEPGLFWATAINGTAANVQALSSGFVSSGMSCRMELASGDVVNDYAGIYVSRDGTEAYINGLDDNVLVCEMNVRVNSVAADHSMSVGFHNSPATTDNNVFSNVFTYAMFYFYLGNWACVTNSPSTTSNVSIGTYAVNTAYLLRIEIHGANSPVGVAQGNAVCRYFVDGVLVVEETGASSVPSGAAYLTWAARINSGDTIPDNRHMWVGPVRICYLDRPAANEPT